VGARFGSSKDGVVTERRDGCDMHRLSSAQDAILSTVVEKLSRIDAIQAIALGGSHARGRARPDSDIDVGIYYRDDCPFEIAEIRSVAAALNDEADPVVAGFGEWGPWVDGGTWLTIQGQRVDLLYRSLDRIDRVIRDAAEGKFELHYGQQPPFGFFSPTYLGEVHIAVPLIDRERRLASRKAQVREYPEALRRSIVQDCLWAVDFGLAAFAPKFARAGDPYGTVGCLVRFIHQLVLVLFALNRIYLLNDKTALAEANEFRIAPERFGSRVGSLLARPGGSVETLETAVYGVAELFRETVELAGDLYTPHRSP
jgi:predicted nucleotidyltransferase